ncbi:hypothetical protein NDN08_005125 [Rhodosorus marinus]|uniref:HORMA domain-containing protein n=1 Tax=Rhodosorus marinus TaxID=101924 RepID=A0AAV8V3A5_9RHOD|nr:hypothetical protein NDN08_005125 [Rhodosorus marinus]
MKLQKLTGSDNGEAKLLIKWLEQGVFDALEKKYLESILLEIFDGAPKSVSGSLISDPSQLLEQYIFSVSYPNDMPELAMSQNKNVAGGQPRLGSTGSAPTSSRQQLKESTYSVSANSRGYQCILAHPAIVSARARTQILQNLINYANDLQALPDDRMVSIKLLYRDEVTPEDYEPKFFQSDDLDSSPSWFSELELGKEIGDIASPYHAIKIHVKNKDVFKNITPNPQASAGASPHTAIAKNPPGDVQSHLSNLTIGRESTLRLRRKARPKTTTEETTTDKKVPNPDDKEQKFLENVLCSQEVESTRKRKASKVKDPIHQRHSTRRCA